MKKTNDCGFTLVELLIVIAIMGILATMAIPNLSDRVIRTQIKEAMGLAEYAQDSVESYYKIKGTMPKNNSAAGLPHKDKIKGNYVTSLEIKNGTVVVILGNRVNKHVKDKKLSFRPATVKGANGVPIAWVCGLASVPGGMTAPKENETDLKPQHLPVNCRY